MIASGCEVSASYLCHLRMLAVFEKSISKPPKGAEPSSEELLEHVNISEEIIEIFRSWSTFLHLSGCNFLALSYQDENPEIPRAQHL
ncbi:hypothetical protein AAHA92_30346 [Salvia divinorum]|uniref:Uncharacterized protein n=1 Tax=Salvia divinorum TaxID=28513 RepID=A0ABD1G1T0_SALDI